MRAVMRQARIAALLSLFGVLVAVPPSFAQALNGKGTDRFVTLVARECPAYTDITANRARNDIQESLRNLGADTPYRPGQPIDPAIESANQPDCTPLPDWTFTLGTGYASRAVSGPWGSLSIVKSPYDTNIVTQAQVPLRDYAGRPTGRFIDGATTIELTPAQAERASRASSLWIQGGTVADPILNQQFPDEFGFGALRCAVDNLNGDNVEWISYPQGTEHVFCYAYYVRPPPTSGTIVIRKEIRSEEPATQTFSFDGNLSFNQGGLFNLRVDNGRAASQTFFRGATGPGDDPWTVRELAPGGWNLADLDCAAQGSSTAAIDLAAGRADITLAAGDRITCTYVNEVDPPAGELFLRKLTRDSIGSFDFTVTPAGGGGAFDAEATTQEDRVAVDAQPSPLTLAPGRYRLDERVPESRGGRWRLDDVICDGQVLPNPEQAEVTISDGAGATCTFENSFVASGEIEIDKVTLGGVTTTGFVIWPVDDPETPYRKVATTEGPGDPASATGSDTDQLPLGSYVIQELEPASLARRNWSLVEVVCNGRTLPSIEGRVVVTLTRDTPLERCRFTNSVVDVPIPIEPPGPNHIPGGEDPNLVITKTPDRPVVTAGEVVTYRVTVRNIGAATAEGVVVTDAAAAGTRVVSARVRGNRCRTGSVLHCRIANIPPGRSITSKIRMRLTRPGISRNVAVVNTDSPEPTDRRNVAAARVRVGRVPRFCVSRLLRAAC
ncbi:MAG: DUF11 domain-containing protein [Chloroflexota bacterium]|nr:DUF11 domain-containing protein [Chloroflexota bacterium]